MRPGGGMKNEDDWKSRNGLRKEPMIFPNHTRSGPEKYKSALALGLEHVGRKGQCKATESLKLLREIQGGKGPSGAKPSA